jgi:hypothetical protein
MKKYKIKNRSQKNSHSCEPLSDTSHGHWTKCSSRMCPDLEDRSRDSSSAHNCAIIKQAQPLVLTLRYAMLWPRPFFIVLPRGNIEYGTAQTGTHCSWDISSKGTKNPRKKRPRTVYTGTLRHITLLT